MDSPKVTSTFRSLIAIGLIVAIVTALVAVVSAPFYVILFGAALVFVILDAAVPGGIVSGKQRRLRLLPTRARGLVRR